MHNFLYRRKWIDMLFLLVFVFSLVQAPLPAIANPQTGSTIFLPILFNGKPAPSGSNPSSQDLIEAALASGHLDKETALIYQVYAIFGDPRLPAIYKGDDSRMLDSMVMLHVQESWDTLSTAGKAILLPLIMPPNGFSAGTSAPNALQPQATPNPTWPNVEAMGGWALIWYPPDLANGLSLANGLKNALETRIWAKLTGLMGVQPLSDLGSPQQVGPDGALDIYIVNSLAGALGLTTPIARSTPPPDGGGCGSWPTYIEIKAGTLGDDNTKGMVQILAHEFMHSLQFAINVSSTCAEYDWLREATATWAMDYTYPKANSEQVYAKDYLDTTDLPLEDTSGNREYGAYLLPFFLSHWKSPDVIGTIWENTRTMNSLAAVDQAVPDMPFDKFWWFFLSNLWNRAPFGKGFQDDGLTFQLKPEGDAPIAVTVPGGEYTYQGAAAVEHLTSRFYHFKFNSNSASLVIFLNGVNYGLSKQPWEGSDYAMPDGSLTYAIQDLTSEETKGASVTALIKIAGQDWTIESWNSDRQAYCRDRSDQRLEELVIIVGNHEFADRTHTLQYQDQPPTLLASNVGCKKWVGTSTYSNEDHGVTETSSATGIVFEEFFSFPGYTAYTTTYPELLFKLTNAEVAWNISGTDMAGCTHSGSDNYTATYEDGHIQDLSLFPGLISGPSYRGLTGIGKAISTQEVNDHVTCDWGSYDDTGYPTEFLHTNWEQLSKISEDGRTIQGSYGFEDNNGTHTWTWNLHAESD